MAQSPLCKSIARVVTASLTAEAPVVTHQSNLPKPWQTRKRAGVSMRAVNADVTGVTVHDFVKVVMAEMEPLFERTITSAVATAIEAMLPQLEASMSKEIGDLRSTLQSQTFEHDRLPQYSRRENGRLHGVPETAGDNTNDGRAHRRTRHLCQPPPTAITPDHCKVCASRHQNCSVTDCAEASPKGTRWMASSLRAYSALKHCVSCLEIVVVYGVILA